VDGFPYNYAPTFSVRYAVHNSPSRRMSPGFGGKLDLEPEIGGHRM